MPLRDEVMEYLSRIDGGCAWWGSMSGSPDINFVLCGEYYGFYVRPVGRRMTESQRRVKRIIADANGVVTSIQEISDVERVLARDERRYRLHRALPVSEMRRLLKEWANEDHRLLWVGELARELPYKEQRVVYARYIDKMPMDEIARELEYTDRHTYRILKDAIERMIEWALEGRKGRQC